MTIYFDMDGTIADLYGQEDWLKKLRNEDASPYKQAKPLVDMEELKDLCLQLIAKNINIGVITWLSKGASEKYKKAIRQAKKEWLQKYFNIYTELHMIQYGTSKYQVAKDKNSVLIDDDKKILQQWNNNRHKKGFAIDATEGVLEYLRILNKVIV